MASLPLTRRSTVLLPLLLLTGASWPLAGCGDDADGAPSTGTQGVGGGGTGGQGGAGGSEVPTTCDASGPIEHPTCSGDACPITLDVELRCTDRSFAEYGVRVAPAPEAVSVAIASPDEVRVARVTADVIRTDLSPFESVPAPILLAATREGAIRAAADETTIDGSTSPAGYPGALVLASSPDGIAFTLEEVADNEDKYIPVVDLEMGPDGSPFVFHSAFPGFAVATRSAGVWTSAPIDAGDTGYGRFSVTASGEVVVVTIADGAIGQLLARVGAGPQIALGAPLDAYGVSFRVAQAPTGDLPAGAPAFAVIAQRPGGVSVLWPDAAGPEEIVVPGSESAAPTCSVGFGDPTDCPTTPCVEQAVGVTPDAYAIARTTDGAAWVAYVVTAFDVTIAYENQCGEPPSTECFCVGNVTSDASTSELHVVRVPPGGAAPEPVLALPVGRLVAGPNSTGHSALHAVDARAFGTDLATALRTLDASGEPAVRVVRLRGETP